MAGLKNRYERDCLTAMIRDPKSIFVYWMLCAKGAGSVRQTLGEDLFQSTDFWLVVQQKETGAINSYKLDAEIGSLNLNVMADQIIAISLEIRSGQDDCLVVLTAAEIKTPPLSFSMVHDIQWGVLGEDADRLMTLGWPEWPAARGAELAIFSSWMEGNDSKEDPSADDVLITGVPGS